MKGDLTDNGFFIGGIALAALALGVALAAAVLAGIFMAWQPLRVYIAEYSVRTETLRGEAELRRAEQNRQIQVQQAQAERDAAELRAEAISIVGQAAQDFPEYRYQEFLGAFAEALNDGSIDQIVYIPTEANIPITDAGRLVSRP